MTAAQARQRAATLTVETGFVHLAKSQASEWVVVRTSLAKTDRVAADADRGVPAALPADVRPSLLRQVPPYGAGG